MSLFRMISCVGLMDTAIGVVPTRVVAVVRIMAVVAMMTTMTTMMMIQDVSPQRQESPFKGGESVSMAELSVGDKVQSGQGVFFKFTIWLTNW